MAAELPEGVPEEHPVVLFDGVCSLCESSVTFLIERDPAGVFRFAPLQSPIAETLLQDHDVEPGALESLVFVDGDNVYTKSDAVLQISRHLGGPYRLLPPFQVLPKPFRNGLYDFIADRRYGWFGKKDQCMMPTADISARFLAGGPGTAPSTEE